LKSSIGRAEVARAANAATLMSSPPSSVHTTSSTRSRSA
jgi:hypothetical protein